MNKWKKEEYSALLFIGTIIGIIIGWAILNYHLFFIIQQILNTIDNILVQMGIIMIYAVSLAGNIHVTWAVVYGSIRYTLD